MTSRQIEVYKAIVKFYNNNKKYPTLNELAIKTKRAKSSTCEILKRMEKAGYIRIIPKKNRGIRLIEMIEIVDNM